MIIVGAFKAKTHLSQLLEQVSHGEEVLITKRGKAVARLVPASDPDETVIGAAIADLRALRQETTLGGVNWKDLRDEDRR